MGAQVFAAATLSWPAPMSAAERQLLHGHVPELAVRLRPIGRVAASKRLDLVLGLPLRNQEALATLLQQIYDPASANFRHYLSAPQFAEMFGPTEQEYQSLIDYARSNGFSVAGTHPNRTLLEVNASVGDIESAFHVTMRVYQHPTEARTFYAPDREPSLDFAIPVLHISGLDNHAPPQSNFRVERRDKRGKGTPNIGSGPAGEYMGPDFRAAYAPGVTLDGSGQTVGLLQFDGYFASDITAYEALNGLPNVPLQNILLNGFDGTPSADTTEISLDIEVVIAMAPGISKVYVYEGTSLDTMLNRMATDNLSRQLSTSWSQGGGYDGSAEQVFRQFAAQGQSFSSASGDSGARAGPASAPEDSTNITVVGGTVLTTSGPGGSWVSESAWNGGGGGVSATFAIPWWQKGLDISHNQGSATMRNVPDVALTASGVYFIANNGTNAGSVGGTSVASPLWAGFMALVNQQAALIGKPPVGFINPALYSIGGSAFHDITTGNNTNSASPSAFSAVPGYDLCTGWGTPNGSNLINALVNFGVDVWVQLGNSDPGDGTYDHPYNTLARGVNGVQPGRTIGIRAPGFSSETMPISKPMTIRAVGGSVTIGH
jgi:subtilase family serine protease